MTKNEIFKQYVRDSHEREYITKMCGLYFTATCRANQDNGFTWEGIRNSTKDLIIALAATHGLSARFDPYNYPDKVAFWDPTVEGSYFRIDGFTETVIEEK